MRKLFPLVICLLCCSVYSANAQPTPPQVREAEWKSYALPQTNFTRQTNADKDIVFRVPADWKQEGTELIFDGPHSSRIRVYIQKIPDGYSLREYFASFLQVVKDIPGATEVTVTRKTQIQDLEAREISLELPTPDGEISHRTSWIVVNGPLAVTISLQVSVAHVAEVEPFFKAVVQSVMFLPREHKKFDELRSTTLKGSAPGPLNEIESLVASLNEAGIDRDAAIVKLSSLFSSSPDAAIDLLIDRRPLVRAAAIQALARTNNRSLLPFLWEMVDDQEPFAAEAAARIVAGEPEVVTKTLQESLSGLKFETIARIWPFLAKDKRRELMERIFSVTALNLTTPPPAAKAPSKSEVKVTVSELTPLRPGLPAPEVIVAGSNDPHVQMNALALLSTTAPDEFKLPLARIMASNYDPLIAVGLQVANYRREPLPLESLFKLVASSDKQVSKLAAQNFGLSASTADIPRLEALLSKDSVNAKKSLDDELKLSIKKIRFRQELSTAKSSSEAREIVRKALSDSSLANFAWLYDCEATIAGCAPQITLKRDFTVKPFGENLFPQKVRHYTAIPNPAQAVQKFYETLNGLQMDSPRAQASVALILSANRQALGQQLSAPAEATTLIEYTGIDPNSPIALASWTAGKAPDSIRPAQRRAIVLRVKDRARFERVIEQFQRVSGDFTNLTDYLAIGTRAIAALPALLPLSAQAVMTRDASKTKYSPVHSYSFVGEKEWNGLQVKTIEHRWISSDWQLESAATHIVFIGDTIILTPDLATIRDLLSNLNAQSERQFLADNSEFRKAIERHGDIVYFSDVKAIMAEISETNKDFDFKINEGGALNIGNASWENSHHLAFDESDWAKSLLPFHPNELTAPRDLLPASTIAYYLMKVDLPLAWTSKLGTSFLQDDLQKMTNVWALDFKQEVLTELGPECGAALLDIPDLRNFDGVTWAAFCKLKSNKLADALHAGKLFSGIEPVKDFAVVKDGADSYYIGERHGFLVVTSGEKALAMFNGKSNLAATRDYSRTVEKVPGGIVAFGGYNLEAAVTAASKPAFEGLQGQIAGAIFSIASAFHGQNFFATATAGTVEAKSSVSMDREGRYSVADSVAKGTNITFATVEPGGVPISDQNRLSSLVVRIRAKAAGPIENIKDDIKTANQTVEQKSPQELLLTITARRTGAEKAVQLPVKDPEFAADLKATAEFPADNEQVKNRARQIAGDDRDAWSVARKLADWTHQNLEWKHVVSADAEQTLATREADCSEFSALFVTMARSLGLPARLVSGLAYSGDSFGGHAWVEVWAGRWVELDPTWGTDFVDATHIRNSSSALVTSAALNLIELEVLETRRMIADFQKSPRALAQHLVKVIPTGKQSEIEAALDLATLNDEYMGAGTWSRMSESERNQMSSAYRRVLQEIITGYGKGTPGTKMRLVHLDEQANSAEAICLLESYDALLKLRFVRRNDVWYLVEIHDIDSTLHVVSETIQPTILNIERARAGQKPSTSTTDFVRVLLLLQSDPAKALTLADGTLKIKPDDRSLRLLKALALLNLKKTNEATTLLRELNDEGFAPATFRLASQLNYSDDEKQNKEAITFYERYAQLEPHDPRAFRDLAVVYDNAGELVKAETAYRKVIELNPTAASGYLSLIHFLVLQHRFKEVGSLLVAGEKHSDDAEDLFGAVMETLGLVDDDSTYAVKLAGMEPLRMKTSSRANLALGKMYLDEKRYTAALQLLQTSARLDKTAAAPYIVMATIHRRQHRWIAALKAAEQAISLNEKDGEAHYERACALARLGRIKEAMSALEKAIELYPDQADWMSDETDLKALASLPAFKKLLPQPAKQ